VAVLVAEVRRQHPRWGAKRIRMKLLHKPPKGVVIPSTATVNRILVRHGSALVARSRACHEVNPDPWKLPQLLCDTGDHEQRFSSIGIQID
jgi:hypothetical protein